MTALKLIGTSVACALLTVFMVFSWTTIFASLLEINDRDDSFNYPFAVLTFPIHPFYILSNANKDYFRSIILDIMLYGTAFPALVATYTLIWISISQRNAVLILAAVGCTFLYAVASVGHDVMMM